MVAKVGCKRRCALRNGQAERRGEKPTVKRRKERKREKDERAKDRKKGESKRGAPEEKSPKKRRENKSLGSGTKTSKLQSVPEESQIPQRAIKAGSNETTKMGTGERNER